MKRSGPRVTKSIGIEIDVVLLVPRRKYRRPRDARRARASRRAHAAMMNYCDREISRLMLGSPVAGEPGSYSGAMAHPYTIYREVT